MAGGKCVGSPKGPCPLTYCLNVQFLSRMMFHRQSSAVMNTRPDNRYQSLSMGSFNPNLMQTSHIELFDGSSGKRIASYGKLSMASFPAVLLVGREYSLNCIFNGDMMVKPSTKDTRSRILRETLFCTFKAKSFPSRGKSLQVTAKGSRMLYGMNKGVVGILGESSEGSRTKRVFKDKNGVVVEEVNEVLETNMTLRGSLDWQDRAPRPTLRFDGNYNSQPIIIDTYALKVGYLYQHRGWKTESHSFRHGNKNHEIKLDPRELCVATCMTMVLRYYGIPVDVRKVCEAAARRALQGKVPEGAEVYSPNTVQESNQVRLRYKKRPDYWEWPHNNPDVLAGASADILSEKGPWIPIEMVDDNNIVTLNNGRDLKFFLGQGWPVILFTIGEDPNHAIVCRGVVTNEKGGLEKIYINDPWNWDNDVLKPSDKKRYTGWILVGRHLRQDQVRPDRLLNSAKGLAWLESTL